MADQVRTKMTAAEYFQRPDTNKPEALIHGELILDPMPTLNHQTVLMNTAVLLHHFAKLLSGVVYHFVSVYLDEENVLTPDVVWIAPDGKCIVGEKYLIGAPDLIIEVLSVGTEKRDRGTKFQLYERYGVRDTGLCNPLRNMLRFSF
jgi:Uma2 family endonuclease